MGVTVARRRATNLLAGIRAGGTTSIAFPSAWMRSVAVMEAEIFRIVHLPLRGQRRLGRLLPAWPSCFPLNCGLWTKPRAPTRGFYNRIALPPTML